MDGGGEPIEVGPEVLDKVMCDAVELGRIDGDQPERARRKTPPAIRKRVLHRDNGRCVVPGCRSTIHCEVHHIVFREDHGGDEMSNLITLCGACHDRLHDGTLTITGLAPGELTFTWADGRSTGGADVKDKQVFEDAVSALVNLQFKKAAAWSAVAEARAHVGAQVALEELIRTALRILRPPRVD